MRLLQAATRGALDKVPKEKFTLEELLEADSTKRNVFHFAVLNRQLNEIPKKFLTLKNLSTETAVGNDCFTLAADHGRLNELPKEFLTPKTILGEARRANVLHHHLLAGGNWIDLNPRECILYLKDLKDIRKKIKYILERKPALELGNRDMYEEKERMMGRFIKNIEAQIQLRKMPALKI